jgi:hypothetical protein
MKWFIALVIAVVAVVAASGPDLFHQPVPIDPIVTIRNDTVECSRPVISSTWTCYPRPAAKQ